VKIRRDFKMIFSKLKGFNKIFLFVLIFFLSCNSKSNIKEFDHEINQYFEEAERLYKQNDYKLALKYMNKIIKKEKSDSDFYYNRALILIKLEEYKKAIVDLKKSIKIKTHDDAYFNLGYCYSKIERDNDAIIYFSKAIIIENNNGDYYFSRGLSYENLKVYDRAIRDFNKSIDLNYNIVYCYLEIGNIYYQKGEFEKSVEYYVKAYEIDNKNIEILYNIVSFYLDDPKEPIILFDKTSKYNKLSDSTIAFKWAKVLEELILNINEDEIDKVELASYYNLLSESYFFSVDRLEEKEKINKTFKYAEIAMTLDKKNKYYKKDFKNIKKYFKEWEKAPDTFLKIKRF
jgi:tetratricopeptide (TPR) repeat protein